jgi:hypothetical protein
MSVFPSTVYRLSERPKAVSISDDAKPRESTKARKIREREEAYQRAVEKEQRRIENSRRELEERLERKDRERKAKFDARLAECKASALRSQSRREWAKEAPRDHSWCKSNFVLEDVYAFACLPYRGPRESTGIT